jgi:hypothetical protein
VTHHVTTDGEHHRDELAKEAASKVAVLRADLRGVGSGSVDVSHSSARIDHSAFHL